MAYSKSMTFYTVSWQKRNALNWWKTTTITALVKWINILNISANSTDKLQQISHNFRTHHCHIIHIIQLLGTPKNFHLTSLLLM